MTLIGSGVSMADQYRPDEFLNLDLSKAVFSSKPLGPPAEFKPGPLDLTVDRGSQGTQAHGEPLAAPKIVIHKMHVAHARKEPPRHAPVRTRLAHRHRNPLDAQALDTRIQVWPCKSGGICNWRQ
jgi:hypothetical protein